MFDNGLTVVFAVLMSIWATTFLEGWKRHHAEMAFSWDLHDMAPDEIPMRPQFQVPLPPPSHPADLGRSVR